MNCGVCIAIGLYILTLIVLTFLARSKKTSDFLRASNNIGWKEMSVSLFASMFSSYNLVVGLTFSFLFGPLVLLVYFGALLAFYVIYHLIKKQRLKGIDDKRFNSVIDYVRSQFGMRNAKIVNVILIMILFIFIALQFFVNTTVFSELIGWNKYLSIISVGLIVLIYTSIAGLKVEIYTDIFQGILMLFFAGLLFFVDTSNLTIQTMKPFLTNTTLIVGAVSFATAQFLTVLIQPEMWQRYYAVKDNKEIKKGIFASYGLILLLVIPLILIGLSASVNGSIENPQNLFYEIIANSSPKKYLPFLLVAIFAAFMSSIDSSLFAISSQISKYGFFSTKPLLDKSEEKKEVANTRIAMVVVTILTMITSIFFSNFLTYVIQLVSLATVLSTVMIASLILKVSQKSTFYAFILGTLLFIIFSYSGLITDDPKSVLYPSIITLFFLIGLKIFSHKKN